MVYKFDKQDVMNILTLIIAITAIWSSYETRRLVENQIQPDIYFRVAPSIAFDSLATGLAWSAPYTSFLNNYSNLTIEIINKGNKPIKVLEIYLNADHCLTPDNINSILIAPSVIEPGKGIRYDSNILSTNLNRWLVEHHKLCNIVFELKTDSGSRFDGGTLYSV